MFFIHILRDTTNTKDTIFPSISYIKAEDPEIACLWPPNLQVF